MKNYFLFITAFFILSCDKWEEVEVTVKNLSERAIYAQVCANYGYDSAGDEPYNLTEFDKVRINEGESDIISSYENIGPGRKLMQWKYITVHFYDADEYEKIVYSDDFDNNFSDPRFYLGSKKYTQAEITGFSYNIVYPFEESSESSE